MSFVIGDDVRVAVDAGHVEEVLTPRPLTPLPGAPRHVTGIAQIRGRPVPVVDLAPFFSLPPTAGGDDAMPRLILVEAGSMEVALVAREVVIDDADLADDATDPMTYGERLRPFVRLHARTRRGVAVVLHLADLLEAARVRD